MAAHPLAWRIRESHPEHLLLAAAIALGPFREHRDYSVGLAILWLSLHWIQDLWRSRHQIHQRVNTIIPGIALGLLLIQSRMLLTMEDYEGPTRYLIIAFTLLVGSQLSIKSWKHLLKYITAGALALGFVLYFQWSWGNFSSLSLTNKYALGEGFGGINMLGSVLDLLTVFSVYSLRISSSYWTRLLAFFSALTTYSLCLASNSRMAAMAPLLAIFFAWVISEGWEKSKRIEKQKRKLLISLFGLIPLLTYWYFAIRPDISIGMINDTARLRIWSCSLQNSIFAGNNRIAYGNGFQWKSIQEACGQWQAHSSYVHFLSMHGLLGLISLGIILLMVLKGIKTHLHHRENSRSLWRSSWGEIALGSTLVVMFTAVSSTTYLGGYLNPFLIGLALSMALAPLPGSRGDHEPSKPEVRINSN